MEVHNKRRSFLASALAFDGRTEFTMPFSAVMFNSQPEPPEPIVVP